MPCLQSGKFLAAIYQHSQAEGSPCNCLAKAQVFDVRRRRHVPGSCAAWLQHLVS